MSQPKDPVGWDEDRVRRVLEHYETQSDEEAPGDLVLTGTPAGVGMGRGRFLKAGDVVKLWIEGIGDLSNTMTA